MSHVSPLLHKVNHSREAPSEAYILYNIDGGIFYVDFKDFSNFVTQWIGISKPPPLTMDLSSSYTHSLILDFDYPPSAKTPSSKIFATVETALKMTLLPAIPHFTYIVARRAGRYGLHVHLPEVSVAHDDYALFCEILQRQFMLLSGSDQSYKLDILANAMLPGAAKPGATAYFPCYLVYVDEQNTVTFDLNSFKEDYETVKKKFPKRRSNENSLFRSLLKLSSLNYLMVELKQLLMPVVVGRVDSPTHTLFFATFIGKYHDRSSDWKEVATFTYKRTGELGCISKAPKMVFDQYKLLRVFFHLKLNARNMVDFTTSNHAIKMWFERFSLTVDTSHIPPFFRDLHETLQFEHLSLSEDPNPIKTIMQFKEGYYFLPVFWALCQHYRTSMAEMAEQLRALLDTKYHAQLAQVGATDPKNVEFTTTEMSVNTIHFCADNLHPQLPGSNREKLKMVVENNQRAILSVTTSDQMAELLRRMQDRHLPIYMFKMKSALKKPTRWIWNTLLESWQEMQEREVSDHMQNLWIYVKQFCLGYKQSGSRGGPDDEIVNRFNVASVVSTIMSDTAMERKDIQMDAHKWLLRLQDGVLDLQTGHIGGVVPEFFLSDRKIVLGIPRPQMMQLCNESPELEAVYAKLVDKAHFLQYLKALFLDSGETLVDPLLPLAADTAEKDLATSMLHFFVNLCKCTCFEYDLILYMLDILASVLVGTNYERKFFVWKGLTRNGKSKLFELMSQVLGGYYHAIQSENLSPGNSSSNANPELASTLFSCRMVTSEELEKRLDENRVKQITGNSFVAFRNLYEQNSGGIPTAKVFATTNNYPECKASQAFKDRVVAIPFDAEFVDKAPARTSEQLERNTFRKDAYVVEQSYRGCFLMLYYHLRQHMSAEDGLLHYRQEPECVVEFTQDYLIHADVYVQFKLHMDIQLKAGYQTTRNDVKSAVRQYLKTTKNTSFHETDLLAEFEKEFGELRQTDIKVAYESFSYMCASEEEVGPPSKKANLDADASLIFYDGVVIKNLRRQNLDD